MSFTQHYEYRDCASMDLRKGGNGLKAGHRIVLYCAVL